MKVTFLGCGASAGVPSVSSGFGVCDPSEHRNNRTRSSIFIESDNTNLLIDTSPDLRYQLLQHNIKRIDNVLITHIHSDHSLGFDELRQIYFINDKKINIYSTTKVFNDLQKIFPHMFGSDVGYFWGDAITPIVLDDNPVNLKDFNFQWFLQDHFYSNSIGIRINDFAYTTDVRCFYEDNIKFLYGLDTWVVGCVRYNKTKSHLCVQDVIELVKKQNPKRTILTHMSNEIDYVTIKNELIEYNIEPAYDGMVIDC